MRCIIGTINKNIKMLELNYDKQVKDGRLEYIKNYDNYNYIVTKYGLSHKKYCSKSRAENTAGIILDTYKSINRLDDLEKIVRKSSGDVYNRTLHHVYKYHLPN
jgi:hypothetical protein